MKEFVLKALTERDATLIDDRHVYLHVDFALGQQAVINLIEYFVTQMILPLKDEFIYEIALEDRHRVPLSHMMSLFQRDLGEGTASICMEIYKKTEKITSLAALNRFENHWYSNEVFIVNEKYRKKQDVLRKRIKKAIKMGTIKENIINKGEHVAAGKPGFSDLSMGISCEAFEANSLRFYGTLDFAVSTYSLGENVNIAAAYLVEVLKELCAIDSDIGGFISMGAYHASEKKEFFFYDDNIVIRNDGYEYATKEWLHLNYIDNIEWFNILTPTIAEKLSDKERLELSDEVLFQVHPDGKVILGIKKNLESYRAINWEPYYDCVRLCQKPGYSEEEMLTSLLLERDLYFAPDEYQIEGDIIYFRR